MRSVSPEVIRHAAKVLGCLGHPQRLRIVEHLGKGSCPVMELSRHLKLEQVAVSKHLATLRSAGIVRRDPKGNCRYYSLADSKVLKILECMGQMKGA